MNIVEQRAIEDAKRLIRSNPRTSMDSLSDEIGSKLYVFRNERNKLDYLKVFQTEVSRSLEDHRSKCSQPNTCVIDKLHSTILFLVEQEIDDINQYYEYEPKKEDKFSSQEESKIHSKLNEIFEKLKEQSIGQEILYDEIEELKNHFNIGKKNWFQLFRVKFFDLAASGVIEESAIKPLVEYVRDEAQKLLE